MVNTFTESIWPIVQTHAWKYEPRNERITTLLVHATRSGIAGRSSTQEYGSTKNWFSSANNRTVDRQGRVSAGMTNRIIGDRGKLCVALPDEFYPTWSAGHMDPEALSYELAQATNGDPFDPLDLERLEHELAKDCKRLGIPARCVLYMHGDNREAPGIAFHDASANGDLLGKSDPGTQPPFNDRERWVREKIVPLVKEEDDVAAIELVWSYETNQLFVLGQGDPRWVADPAAAADLEKAYGKPQKALSKKALQALGAKI